MSVDLYQITLPDGRAYIGVAVKPRRRFIEHCRAETILGQTIRDVGAANVSFKTLIKGERNYIYSLEPSAIKVFATRWPNGFNLSVGGFGCRDPLPVTRTKQSLAAKSRAPELAALAIKTHKGRKRTPETKIRISLAAQLRAPPSDKTRAQMSASHKARPRKRMPNWVKEKISATKRARFCADVPRGGNGRWL